MIGYTLTDRAVKTLREMARKMQRPRPYVPPVPSRRISSLGGTGPERWGKIMFYGDQGKTLIVQEWDAEGVPVTTGDPPIPVYLEVRVRSYGEEPGMIGEVDLALVWPPLAVGDAIAFESANVFVPFGGGVPQDGDPIPEGEWVSALWATGTYALVGCEDA